MRKNSADWVVVEPTQDYTNSPVAIVDGKLYLYTSVGAPRNRFVLVDPKTPTSKDWKDIISEDPDGGVLTSVQFAGPDHLIAVYDRDASNHAYLYTKDGQKIREIELPTYGTVGFSTSRDNDEVFYSFSSFTYPSALYKYDIKTGESKLYHKTEIEGFNPEDYVTEQVFYTSSDGTKVPMFTVRRKDVERSEEHTSELQSR